MLPPKRNVYPGEEVEAVTPRVTLAQMCVAWDDLFGEPVDRARLEALLTSAELDPGSPEGGGVTWRQFEQLVLSDEFAQEMLSTTTTVSTLAGAVQDKPSLKDLCVTNGENT